ncbi:MAG: helix-turn-helix transcriptional regulator [Lachnospiraceae bacterium]|nr:helix-turn-helix transcriptional regulator [Lachnospiraceae bacterium]
MKKTIDKTTIGGRIKAARKELGMTQEELAEMMCITGALVCCYEKDKVDLPLSVIRELAKHLHVSASYLVDGIKSEIDTDSMEILKAFMAINSDEAKRIALIQIRALREL